MNQLRPLFRLAFFAALVFAFVMATLPRPPQLLLQTSDGIQHALAFVVLTLLAILAWPGRLVRIGLGLAAYGALIEFVQTIPALHRAAELRDWLIDVAAVAAVLGAAIVLRHFGAGAKRA